MKLERLGYPVVDLHVHMRQDRHHLVAACDGGISTVVCMPNTSPCLDNREAIEQYDAMLGREFMRTKAFPTSAITIGREGKTPVDFEANRPLVVGFSDDGNCLEDLDIFRRGLEHGVLMMMHCEPETEMAEKYIDVYSQVGKGHLHIQHVSLASTVKVLYETKQSGLKFTAETCPHYFTYDCFAESHPVNPPLATPGDVEIIRRGLAIGAIDVIASDYAPLPRPKGTGFASFLSFIPLSYGLVLDGTLTLEQLKEKIHTNPLKIIASGNPTLLR